MNFEKLRRSKTLFYRCTGLDEYLGCIENNKLAEWFDLLAICDSI